MNPKFHKDIKLSNLVDYKTIYVFYLHPMFTAAWFTITEIWNKPRCPPHDDWIKKMLCIYRWNST